MGFAGELATIGLPEVFRNVAFSHLTGVLRVHGGGQDAAIYFKHGIIRAFSGGADVVFDYETLAERAGAAPPDAIERARSRPRKRTLRDALLETEHFLAESFHDAVSEAVREEIVSLFGSLEASFVFEEGSPPQGLFDAEQIGCELDIDAETLAVEASQRHNEWRAISARIGSEDEFYVASPDVADDRPAAVALLERLDGTRDLRTAMQGLPFSRLDLFRVAAELIEADAVSPAATDHMLALAGQAEDGSEINRAARLLRTAIRHAPDDIELHRELVGLFTRAERLRDAAAANKNMGEAQERLGDVKGASDSYSEAVRMAPHDTDALQRIVVIHEARGDMRTFIEAGRRLADALSAQGQHDAAVGVLQDLLGRDPANIKLRETLATTYIKMHEPQNAVSELLHLADSAAAVDGYHRALHYYRSVLAVDRNCTVAADRIRELQSDRVKAHRRTRRRRRLAALLAVVLGLAFWQGAREMSAQEALHNVAQATTGRDGATAVARYADVYHAFPYTRGAVHAEEMVRVLLLEELERIRATRDASALDWLGSIPFPPGVKDLWRKARDDIRARASGWAKR